jgi:glycosyltransferase involved in cell wall biosynthesis
VTSQSPVDFEPVDVGDTPSIAASDRDLSLAQSREMESVSIFLTDLRGGGAERMMVQLATGMADRGIRVDLVLAHAVGPYLKDLPDTVRLVDLGRGATAAALRPLIAYLRRARPDVLLSTLHHTAVVAALARRFAGGPTVLFVREANTPSARQLSAIDLKARITRRAMRWAYATADGVIAVSEGVAEDLRRHRGVPDHKLWTLYNPVVTPDVPVRAAEDPGHPWLGSEGPPVVLGVGSLQPRKGFTTLLTAFARLREDREARLIVLGEGPQRTELEARARELGVADDVDFPGFVVNPFAFMSRADVFVLSSEREGLPGVLIQALACGCPVVATDCPSGPREILEGGRHGELVPVGDAAAMCSAINRTLDAHPEPQNLVARAARFASDRVVAAHIDVFERAVRHRRHEAVAR